MGLLTRCEQCGRFHGAEEKCRLKWGRRGFLAMLGAIPAMAATGLPAWADPPPGRYRFASISFDYESAGPCVVAVQVVIDGKPHSCRANLSPRFIRGHESIQLPFDVSGKRIDSCRISLSAVDKRRSFCVEGINSSFMSAHPPRYPRVAAFTDYYGSFADWKHVGNMWGWG